MRADRDRVRSGIDGSSTTLLAQLTDPHVHVGRRDGGPAKSRAAAVRAVLELKVRPHAVLVTGDLVHTPGARESTRPVKPKRRHDLGVNVDP